MISLDQLQDFIYYAARQVIPDLYRKSPDWLTTKANFDVSKGDFDDDNMSLEVIVWISTGQTRLSATGEEEHGHEVIGCKITKSWKEWCGGDRMHGSRQIYEALYKILEEWFAKLTADLEPGGVLRGGDNDHT